MAYSYIDWTVDTDLSSANFKQMSDNDQYLHDIYHPAPRGVIAHQTVDLDFFTSEVDSDFLQWADFNIQGLFIDSARMLRINLSWQQTLLYNLVAENKAALHVGVEIDGSEVANTVSDIDGGFRRTVNGIKHLVSPALSKGTHNFSARVGLVNVVTQGPKAGLRARWNQPAQFWIEDLGPYVPKT